MYFVVWVGKVNLYLWIIQENLINFYLVYAQAELGLLDDGWTVHIVLLFFMFVNETASANYLLL